MADTHVHIYGALQQFMMKEFHMDDAHVSITMLAYLRPQVLLGMTISAMLQVRAHGRILSTALIHYGMAEDVEQQIAAALETAPRNLLKPWMHLPMTTLNSGYAAVKIVEMKIY